MDRIVKLLIAQIGFVFLGIILGAVLSDMIVNGISALLIIYYPDVRSVYEIIGTKPFAGLAVLGVILSAICIYYLNRSLKVPAWQILENRDGETGNIVINE